MVNVSVDVIPCLPVIVEHISLATSSTADSRSDAEKHDYELMRGFILLVWWSVTNH